MPSLVEQEHSRGYRDGWSAYQEQGRWVLRTIPEARPGEGIAAISYRLGYEAGCMDAYDHYDREEE